MREAAEERPEWQEGDLDHEAIAQIIDARASEIYEELRASNLDHDLMIELELEEVKIRVMALCYILRYGIDQRREVEFTLLLIDPETGEPSEEFVRGGKMDGVISMGPQRVRVIEDKLVSQIQRVMILRLPLDDQISEYVDAFRAKGWEADVSYRHTRFPGTKPKTPKEFKTKPDYPGESLDEYESRLLAEVMDDMDYYFDEQILFFPTEHLDEYAQGRWDTAQDILHAHETNRFYLNPSRCWEYGGCEYIPLCTQQVGAPDLYVPSVDNEELPTIMAELGAREA